jgi:ABC-type polysaccharide/polyol phosphate export permease
MTEIAETAPAAGTLGPTRRSAIGELFQYRELIAMLVIRELKVRYKRSIFGLLWTMLNPLLLMVVYTVVFATIMKAPQRNFAIFLLAGLLPWLFFSIAVLQGLHSLLFLPAATLILTVFTSGVTLLFATFTVFFRDVRHLAEVALQMLMYLSPVFYDLHMLGEHDAWWFRAFRLFLKVNPLWYLLELVRDPVYYGHLPPWPVAAVACAAALGALFIGFTVFNRLAPRHIHYL